MTCNFTGGQTLTQEQKLSKKFFVDTKNILCAGLQIPPPPSKCGVVRWGQALIYGMVKMSTHLVCQNILGHWPGLEHTTGHTTWHQVLSQALSTYKCTNKSKSAQKGFSDLQDLQYCICP